MVAEAEWDAEAKLEALVAATEAEWELEAEWEAAVAEAAAAQEAATREHHQRAQLSLPGYRRPPQTPAAAAASGTTRC